MSDGLTAPPDTRTTALTTWWWQGLRSAVLLAPDWRLLRATPAAVLALLAADLLASLCFERLYIAGPARFYWPALLGGWFSTVVAAWVCWWLVPRTGAWRAPASGASLFALFAAQGLPITLVTGAAYLWLDRSGRLAQVTASSAGQWAAWLLPLGWCAAAMLALVWRTTPRHPAVRGLAALLLVGSMLLHQWLQPAQHWHASTPANADTPALLELTQELMELQPRLLQDQLAGLLPQRPGVVDVYAITFAPYADEDVFMRESAMVAGVMATRFGAAGRSLQLVNHRSTAAQWPWATPLNLQRAIQRMAALMDHNEDLLFIHLTSHGAKDGELATEFAPLALDAVTPQLLRQWLDEAGVRYRIVSISACYSGSWIAPLATAGSLVMTAADAEHTSYGCGRGSELTFFGRAMFDEALRKTASFEDAHATARKVIDQREREAGKSDGYSNPQIDVGADIRGPLARLQAQQDKPARGVN